MTEPSGFIPGRFEDFRADVVSLWKEGYGPTSNTASDTPDGQAIDILAIVRTRQAQRTGTVYQNAYYGTAEGLHLDAQLAILRSRRKVPGGSTVEGLMFGSLGTLVEAGSIVTTESGDAFVSNTQETIAQTVFVVFTFGPATITETRAEININGVVYLASSDVLGDGKAVADSVAAVLPAGPGEPTHGEDDRIARWWTPYLDANGNGVLVVELKVSAPFAAFSSEGDAAQWYGDPASFTSEEEAAVPGELLTMNTIGTSTPGWEGVTNLQTATLGSGDQSDADYRIQHTATLGRTGGATPRGLGGTLRDPESNPGVEFARVYMNVEGGVDDAGRPSHSFEPVVAGGAAETIGLIIWKKHTTGTQSFGSSSVTINDPNNGELRVLKYTRPTDRFVWVDIEILKGEGFPTTPIIDIQNDVQGAVFAWGQEKSIGFNIYIDELRHQISIPGTAAIRVKLGTAATAGAAPPPLSLVDLTIDELELTRWNRDRIAVRVVDV